MRLISVRLYLYNNELSRLEFILASGQVISAFRGKAEGAYRGNASFQWTSAVKALTALLIYHSAHNDDSRLSGDKDSSAYSLTYALSKKPEWVKELKLEELKLLSVSNANIKRPGTAALTIYNTRLSAYAIQVFNNAKELTEVAEKQSLARTMLEGAATLEKSLTENHNLFISKFSPHFCQEALFGLRHAININTDFLKITERDFADTLGSYSLKKTLATIKLQENLSSREKLGLGFNPQRLRDKLTKLGGLHIASAQFIAVLVLFQAAAKKYNLPIHLYCDFVTAIEIKNLELQNRLDPRINALCLGTAPAITYLMSGQKLRFGPQSIMPSSSHSIVSNFQVGKVSKLQLLKEDFSNAMIYVQKRLTSEGNSLPKTELCHAEPHESLSYLKNADSNTLAAFFFPFYKLAEDIPGIRPIKEGRTDRWLPSMLFLRNELREDAELVGDLNVCLRDCWYDLLQDPGMLESLAAQTAQLSGVQTVINRIGNV